MWLSNGLSWKTPLHLAVVCVLRTGIGIILNTRDKGADGVSLSEHIRESLFRLIDLLRWPLKTIH